MEIRLMTPEDVPAAEQLRADAFYEVDLRTAPRSEPEPERRAPGNALAWMRRTLRLLETDAGGHWVAADDSGLTGLVSSVVRERLWVLVTFAVRPGLQGKGIGRQLQAKAQAYGAGCERGMLSASDDPLALRRYHAAGFALYPQMVFAGQADRLSYCVVERSQALPTLERDETVFVLDLGDGENRFHPDWVDAVSAALDEVEKAEGPRALVTAATGKFYSNGLDLDWLFAHGDAHEGYIASVHALLARVLSLPVVSVAAMQGHVFAAGAMFSLAHDFRVMRADRGFWCLPEADINLPFTPGMSALIQARLAPQVAHEAMVTARRYGGHDALAAAIIDRAVDEQAVRATAIEIAAAQAAKAGETLATIKARLYASALAALRHQ